MGYPEGRKDSGIEPVWERHQGRREEDGHLAPKQSEGRMQLSINVSVIS